MPNLAKRRDRTIDGTTINTTHPLQGKHSHSRASTACKPSLRTCDGKRRSLRQIIFAGEKSKAHTYANKQNHPIQQCFPYQHISKKCLTHREKCTIFHSKMGIPSKCGGLTQFSSRVKPRNVEGVLFLFSVQGGVKFSVTCDEESASMPL